MSRCRRHRSDNSRRLIKQNVKFTTTLVNTLLKLRAENWTLEGDKLKLVGKVEERCLRQTYDAGVSGSEDDAKTVKILPLRSKLALIAMFLDGLGLGEKDANTLDCCVLIRHLEGCATGFKSLL